MPRFRNSTLLLSFLCLFLAGCGGGRKLSENPVALGVVPFEAGRLAGSEGDLNRLLLQALTFQGAFRVQPLQRSSELLDLEQMEARFGTPNTSADSAAAPADSSAGAVKETLPRLILTGAFLTEREYDKRGQMIPFLLYSPSHRIQAELEYRLYDREAGRWIAMDRILAEIGKGAGKQVVDYNSSDPDLALSAPEQQHLRDQVYRKLFSQLAKTLDKLAGKK